MKINFRENLRLSIEISAVMCYNRKTNWKE